MGASTDEFPLLRALGLYVADTAGNGNCLFNALSDQLYGDQSCHHKIRSRVIEYMREHALYYKQFIDVHPGGGVRRNPKRKNAGAYSTPFNYLPPTAEEIHNVFESHLLQMARGGTYGDNMEISAFSAAYETDVKIYQRDFAYLISSTGGDVRRPVVHIAYHTWEHYSSIRNTKGPHTGLPYVKESYLSPEAEREEREKATKTPCVQPWMINVITQSLPFLADRATIRKTIEECKGSLDAAVSKLLDLEDQGSVSSTQETSSVEREADSDDDALTGPNKKQNRRLISRAEHNALRGIEQRPKKNLAFRLKDQPEASPGSRTTTPQIQINGIKREELNKQEGPSDEEDADESDDEDWQSDPTYKDSHNTSPTPSFITNQPRSGGVRLRLSQPRPEKERQPKPRPKPKLKPKSLITNRSPISSQRPEPPEPIEAPVSTSSAKTQQRQVGPKTKRVTRRDQIDMKKAAQKAAARERKKGIASGRLVNGQHGSVPAENKAGKENSSTIEVGIKTLYI